MEDKRAYYPPSILGLAKELLIMFGFPEQPRAEGFRHKKNLLRTAIFQLKYTRTTTIKEKHEDIERQLLARFPIKKDVMRGEAIIRFEPSKTPILESASGSKEGFEFKSEDDNKVFTITEEAFTYSIFGKVYTNFEDALNEIQQHLLPTLDICGIEAVNRISARKINIVEPSGSADFPATSLLSFAFNEDLLGNITRFPNPAVVNSGVSQITLKSAGYRVNLSYGLLPKPQGAKIDKPQLILDIDLISENKFQIKDVIPEWKKINGEIYNIFSWAISEQLKLSLDT